MPLFSSHCPLEMNYFSNFMIGRSHKERSSYAPKGGFRYDRIYWIEKYWRKIGFQGSKVCRYLFVRCNNDPAPWTRFAFDFF
ncbi:hypothetical protein JRO89_XS11G0040000 [Xanthoceras sorbifolium]|uniref:YDG domain-containing protein n=1 Tax=Xanthoceras sorbifolium TaxID=99658 RepID=A0ABQ8HEJ4_9ROSI|nr:hypothetical protein JRO89_XS11G0040000 [Xanthoceras sorbifolium]